MIDDRGIPIGYDTEKHSGSPYCPDKPCKLCTGRTSDNRQTTWEFCQEMNTCSATIDWDRVYGSY